MAELIFENKKVHYEVHGDGGEPIVLLNGIMMSTASWKPFIEARTRKNTLVLVDFFDQGQSERMKESYDHSIQVALLDAVLEEVSAQIWYEKFTIMGISYGGEIAIQYALSHPNRVGRLVLANTCGRTSGWLKKIGDGWNEVDKTGQGYAYYLTTIPMIYSTKFFEDHAAWMEGREDFLTQHFSKPEVLQALIRLTDSSVSYNVVDRLHEITCPTLIISSSEDVLVPPTEQQLLHAKIKGSVYVTINGSGVSLKLCALHPEKVKEFFDIEGASLKGYPLFVKDEKFQSTGKAYESKEHLATDPLSVAPMIPVFEKKDAAMMTAVWEATIYTVNTPTQEQNELWIAETLKQRNLVDLDWALANLNMSDEYTPYGAGDGSIHKVTCPVALTMGEKDIVVPDYMVLDNYNAFKANATLLPYENCGHSPMVDCPDRLAADVLAFFA